MSISSITNLLSSHSSATGTKHKGAASMFVSMHDLLGDLSSQEGNDSPANSAALSTAKTASASTAPQKTDASSLIPSTTAQTLWQAQSIGQSNVIDAEVEDKKTTQTPEQQFLGQMNKTPDQLMREEVLKEMGYSEDDLKSMDPKQRALVESKIHEIIENKIEESMREKGVDINGANQATQSTEGASAVL